MSCLKLPYDLEKGNKGNVAKEAGVGQSALKDEDQPLFLYFLLFYKNVQFVDQLLPTEPQPFPSSDQVFAPGFCLMFFCSTSLPLATTRWVPLT